MARAASKPTSSIRRDQPAIAEVGADAVRRRAAQVGCDNLLRAHLRSGRHWLTSKAEFDAACASVGLVAL